MSNTHGSKWIRPEKRLAIYLRETRRHQPLNLPLAKALIAGTAGDEELEALR